MKLIDAPARKILFAALAAITIGMTGCDNDDAPVASGTGGTDDSGGNDDGGGSDDVAITLSGSVTARTADVNAVATRSERMREWIVRLYPVNQASAAADTGAAGNEALAAATVTLYKVYGDGRADEAVDIGTVTTADDGSFSIPDVAPAPEGEGAADDFYYEIRVAKGDLELLAPAAPQADGTVNVNPESDLASRILADVVSVPGDAAPPLPRAETIEAMRELVVQNTADLVDDGAIALPSAVGAGAEDNLLAVANGLAAAGGNAEKVFKAASFEAEYLALTTADDTSDAEAASYLARLTREACNQGAQVPLPRALAEALGAFFNTPDNTVTVTELVTAYNANSTGPDVDTAAVLAELGTLSNAVAANLGAAASSVTELAPEQLLALYANRGTLEGIEATTALGIDQAILLLQLLGDGPSCQSNPQLDLYGFVADLIGNQALRAAAISDYRIYHNSGFGCNEGDGDGHFVAEVDVYSAGKTVTGVTIASTDTAALDGDGQISLTAAGSRYTSNTDGICVALGTEVTYTITATFDDTTTATRTVARNHPRIPEASSQVLVDDAFQAGSADENGPTVVDTTRPLYQWTSPEQMLTNIRNDAANTGISDALAASAATVKYTYEFAHVDTGSNPIGPAGQCGSVAAGALYAVDSFIPTVDCDVAACATALGVTADRIACRMNIQSFYVDEHDAVLGQAAGHFRFFCVDTNDDDACG